MLTFIKSAANVERLELVRLDEMAHALMPSNLCSTTSSSHRTIRLISHCCCCPTLIRHEGEVNGAQRTLARLGHARHGPQHHHQHALHVLAAAPEDVARLILLCRDYVK